MDRTFVALSIASLIVLVGLPAAESSHADGSYDQPVWFTWDETTIDALIFPADHGPVFNGNGALGGNPAAEAQPCTNSYTRAMKQSALDWKTAINAFGPTWLKGLVLNVYVIGCDPTPPTAALAEPEILVNSDENKAVILGVSVSTDPCLVFNSKMFVVWFTYNDMYSVAGHEFGHCLGLDHVDGEHPDADILDATVDEPIGSIFNPRHCPSNLNVNALKGVFAAAFGQAGDGVKGTVTTGAYSQIAC